VIRHPGVLCEGNHANSETELLNGNCRVAPPSAPGIRQFAVLLKSLFPCQPPEVCCSNLMFDFLQEPWRPVSRSVAVSSVGVYILFMLYAALDKSGFLFIDNANLVVHEGGHLLFGWFGCTVGIWGGTLLQWLVPALLAAYFCTQRHTTGFTFCLFMLFENFLYTATYMADARAQVLPLVTVGDADVAGHDWFAIFSSLGLLQQDAAIAGCVRLAGWTGMLAACSWLLWRGLQESSE
jgi:hypothetical protein